MASRRNYVTAAEVLEFAGFTPTDVQISEAEEIIDSYVGFQERHFNTHYSELFGKSTGGGSSTITLQQEVVDQQIDIDFFKWCEVEIIAGTGEGQRRVVTGSTAAGVLTVASAWTTAPDSTSFYRIYQLGKFPRYKDVRFFSDTAPYRYIKSIPEAVKRATAAQLEYMNTMGDAFFAGDSTDKVSERIGDYSYSNADGQTSTSGLSRVIAPKARLLLRGIKNRLGEIV